MTDVQRLRTDELSALDVAQVRALLGAAFGDDAEERFTDHDWDHSVGGTHLLVRDGTGDVTAHASVVPRVLHVGDDSYATGYVEAVAVQPHAQGLGLGSAVMAEAAAVVREGYELGALGTGRVAFYTRLGWQVWRGPLHVVRGGRWQRSPDEEGYVLVLRTGRSAGLSLALPMACEERPGDDW